MTLYRVSILDHPRVDYLVSFCGNGAVWCLERIAIVQFYEKRKPEMQEAVTNGRVTGHGFFLPVAQAGALGKRYEIPTGRLVDIWNAAYKKRGEAGRMAERVFKWSVDNRFFEPTFYPGARKASEYEDKHLGIDFVCRTDIADSSGVQVKWDSHAEHSGNLWVQVDTEPVSGEWTQSPSQPRHRAAQ
jgi:hypothetical protein